MDTNTIVQDPNLQPYVPPAVTVCGDATALTQGSAGNDKADDTQYWE